MKSAFRLPLVSLVLLALLPAAAQAEMVTPHCQFAAGPVNGVLIEQDGKRLAVYGWEVEQLDRLLVSHGRRDVAWRAALLAEHGVPVVAPEGERYALANGADFWSRFPESRYHDYAQQSTKLLDQPVPVERWVADGDTVKWQGLTFGVLETPGYTRGSASYVVELDGKRLGFTGDLVYGDGQLLDLYSLQDQIPEAQIRGYHGYAARLADLVASIDKVLAAKCDLLVPSRGPLIRNPQQSLTKLKTRVQAVYHNYLSTNALHWYFKEERMRTCGRRVLGADAKIELMPYCRHEKTPPWIFENSTSRLIISEEGAGFLLDCGSPRVIDAVQDLIDKQVIEKVEGIFVTHYHDDHTDSVQAAAEKFQCPVFATREYADVLERPHAYHLPAMTANPISSVKRVKDGQVLQWYEFKLTFHFFPGQTYFHGALFVEKPDERPVYFIGDAFAPSGIDDYCLLNRNLLHDDEGYLLCLKKVRDAGDCWLINEHIQHVFSFSDKEMKYLEERYRARREVLAELFPWDDPNYGVDEQWAVLHPRGVQAKAGDVVDLELRIQNHSPRARDYRLRHHVGAGLAVLSAGESLELRPGARGVVKLKLRVGRDGPVSRLVTCDISSDGMAFRRWADAQITTR